MKAPRPFLPMSTHRAGIAGRIIAVLVRLVVVGLLIVVALYAGYALAAGYVGGLPSPLNLGAGLIALATAAVAIVRVLRGPRAA